MWLWTVLVNASFALDPLEKRQLAGTTIPDGILLIQEELRNCRVLIVMVAVTPTADGYTFQFEWTIHVQEPKRQVKWACLSIDFIAPTDLSILNIDSECCRNDEARDHVQRITQAGGHAQAQAFGNSLGLEYSQQTSADTEVPRNLVKASGKGTKKAVWTVEENPVAKRGLEQHTRKHDIRVKCEEHTFTVRIKMEAEISGQLWWWRVQASGECTIVADHNHAGVATLALAASSAP